MTITLITGNENKAKYFEEYIDMKVEHYKIDLEEIQSLSLEEVVKHKVFSAFDIVKKPVIVEDVSLEFEAFGRLPGTFIKFFLQEIGPQGLCNIIDKKRNAVARCCIGYYDGQIFKVFEGELKGEISKKSEDEKEGFGWDSIFIPNGYNIARSQLSENDYKKTYLGLRRLDLLKKFLIEDANFKK